jgi:hypothetical protein
MRLTVWLVVGLLFFSLLWIHAAVSTWEISACADSAEEIRLRERANRANADWHDAVDKGAPPEEVARLRQELLDATKVWTEHVWRVTGLEKETRK